MKFKAVLKGNELTLPAVAVLKKKEVKVEVEIPDEDIKVYTENELQRMPLSELIDLVWGKVKLTDEDAKHINNDYKELITEALLEEYR